MKEKFGHIYQLPLEIIHNKGQVIIVIEYIPDYNIGRYDLALQRL